jgi:tRNA (adenine22-N1)-methyltransferase
MDCVGGYMNNTKLSERLQLVLEQIPQGSRLADIGSDHALLPVAAVESGRAVFAIAGEVNEGPFEAARKGVAEAGQGKVISVRRGDGLEVLEPGEVDSITIAGMGGALIAAILDRGRLQGKLEGVTTLALQPNVGEDILRRWLLNHGWVLTAEQILEEDGKIYEILTAVPAAKSEGLTNEEVYGALALADGKVICDQNRLLQMGPWLLRAPNDVFFDKWQGEIRKLESILSSLSRSELASAEDKRKAITGQIKEITEVLQCLPKDRP